MNGSGWVFKVWRHGRAFAMIVGLLAFSARAGATGFFKYAYEFKNGMRLLYLTETTEGYVPGVFLQGRGEEYAHPLESSTSAGEGRGEVWFLECPHVESRFLSVRAEANGAQIQINRTPRSELAFVGTGNRILAIHQDGRFATVADFSKILSSHPGATVQFVTAPGTVSEAGASYRAFEIRFYVPRIDGKDELIIRRGLVSLDFDVVEFPEVRIPLPGLHPQAPVLDFGLFRGSRGPILAFNQLGIHDGDLSMVRSQLYFSDLNQAAAALGDFPLRSRDLALPLPASRHFVEEYAHESFFEFEKR
ncbi:MAG: hypothetical protein EBX52_13235, partial [Proteobacteria bacterium]|nr:hypothetical protein [Pseudomonadota bacterium]